MKKILLAVTLLAILASCKKNDTTTIANKINTPVYQITATVNGKDYVFNRNIEAGVDSISDINFETDAIDNDSIQIALSLEAPYKIKTDTSYTCITNATSAVGFNFVLPDPRRLYRPAGVASFPFTLIFTSVTDTTAQGTFQGAAYLDGDSTQAIVTVTNGKFNVRLQ